MIDDIRAAKLISNFQGSMTEFALTEIYIRVDLLTDKDNQQFPTHPVARDIWLSYIEKMLEAVR